SLKAKGITGAGVMIGTPEYMSPEQVEGKEVDQRSDIYSLGVILYEMVTGRVPFEGDTPLSIAVKHKTETPKEPRELNTQIPEDLSRVILRCMEKDKEKRYQGAGEVHSELENIEKGISSTERYVSKRKPITSKEITVTFGFKRLFVPALIVIAIAVVGLIIWSPWGQKDSASIPTNKLSIAVLPFEDLSPQQDQEYFCDGMTDEIITKLSRLKGWKVISRMSVMRYKNTEEDIKEIGKELNVSTILTGTIRKEKDSIRVSAQLIQVEDRSNLWSEIYNKKLESIFLIQSNIAENIIYALVDKLSPEVGEQLQKNPTESLEAYDFYLLGRSSWNTRNEQGLVKAIDYFEWALQIDPHYAAAYAGLADSYIALPFYSSYPNIEAFEKAKIAAIKALEIDDSLSEAYTSLAFIKTLYDWNRKEAELDFKRALEANPNYATAHQWYALYLLHMGKFEESEEEMKKALELDPLSLILKKDHGIILFYARKYDQAIEILQNTIELDPNYSRVHETLGRIYAEKSMFAEALFEFSQERDLLKTWDPRLDTWIGITYIKSGKKSEGEAILNKMLEESKEIHVPPYFIALLNLALGEQDQCFEWLQKAFKEKDQWLCYLKVDPLVDSARQDPRLKELLQKMKLEDSQ
ncbi:MAG: tetratricopeptide repeat protein, partial [Candidatus Aminicenantes bacterium]